MRTIFDVITMGSNTVDVFAHTEHSQLIDIRSRERRQEFISYPVGSKIIINELLHNFGGNGANTAVCFSRLGLRAGYLGKIGRDINGRMIMENLRKEKVAFLGVRGAESGFSVVLDAFEEDRTILTYKGCNSDLKIREVGLSKLKTRWLYLSSLLGDSLQTMRSIAASAKEKGVKIAFNPSATLLENETKTALDLVRFADLLVLNKEEAESLVGCNAVEVNIKKLKVLGPSIVVITDGKNGAIAYKDETYYEVFPLKGLHVVETTGAGDAFASTLTAGLIMKKSFDVCLRMAINNSEAVISGHGAQTHLLTKKKMLEALANDKHVIEKRKG